MSILNHPEYKKELSKLNYTISYLKNYYDQIIKNKTRIDSEVDYGISHFNSDNAEQFNELIINTNLQDRMAQKLSDIEKGLSKPYFARVDFLEEEHSSNQDIYIGKMSIMNKDQELLVTDWRSPIANLYYEGRLGDSSYTCPDGEIKGKIQLKRQYTIEKSILKEFFDIDITANDDFLQACLGSSTDNRLKDIVSTIQAEQNRVIRADMWNPLIVQGAAGGGKTTIALHRIAYLLYTYENSYNPKNFMIIAPNRFFLSYISDVLPELGVENVRQTTFEEFAVDIIGKKFRIKNSHEKLSSIINHPSLDCENIDQVEKIKEVSKFKSSLQFKAIIESYVEELEKSFIPDIDFKIHTFTLLSYEEIKNLFSVEYKSLPIMKRIIEIKKHLINKLKYNKNKLLEKVELLYDRKIDEIRYSMNDSQERRSLIIKTADERDALLIKIKKSSKTLVKDYMAKITPKPPMEYYINLLSDKKLFSKLSSQYADENLINWVMKESMNIIKDSHIELEDLAPLMYIKYLIYGLDEKIPVRHIIIDEAQDYSLFQMYVLKKVINSSSFTILGDLCQGIHSYRGINNWNDVSKHIFEGCSANMLTLEQSYRTTIEIMDAASSVMNFLNDPNLPPAKPVIRHGDKVTVCKKDSLKEVAQEIKNTLDSMKEMNFKSAAIICKTLDECKKVKSLLKKLKQDVQIIKGGEKEYSGGVVVIPSYLVKGLEFDVVIIANASKEMYTADELDVKLLYVAMTRPLHQLHIYSEGEATELLKAVNS